MKNIMLVFCATLLACSLTLNYFTLKGEISLKAKPEVISKTKFRNSEETGRNFKTLDELVHHMDQTIGD